ncbi:hypothetical protein D3C86_1085780 [compost metagenome]|uniref:Uncharacterized protein n=1 Tax=uncultured organism TaxID=155900 RepID=A0A385FVK8_9ZZZZ|nr:hypothetical protein TRI5_00001 [uncultured organism]
MGSWSSTRVCAFSCTVGSSRGSAAHAAVTWASMSSSPNQRFIVYRLSIAHLFLLRDIRISFMLDFIERNQ